MLDYSLSAKEIDELIRLGLNHRHPQIVSEYRRGLYEVETRCREELKREELMMRQEVEADRPSIEAKVLELMSLPILREYG